MKNAVVVPIYTLNLNNDELLSLKQCNKILGSHDIVVIYPEGLDIKQLHVLFPNMGSESFDPKYFEGIEGYNRLMLSPEFYDRFSNYDYILIYQTDAWVFLDQLDFWCEKGYDYIGAPWIPRHRYAKFFLLLKKLYARITDHSTGALRSWKVGNGGFSLRRPTLFAQLLRKYSDRIPLHFNHVKNNEDVFWSTTMSDYIKTPNWEEAIAFSIEKEPHWAMKHLGHLPFGCHGWFKPPFERFWRPIIIGRESD